MKKIKEINIKNIEELEKEYLEKNNSYYIEQNFLYWLSKDELKKFIKSFRVDYNRVRISYNIKLNKLKKSKNYINWNELEKFLLEQILYFFNNWEEVEDKREILERLNNFYILNFTDFLTKSNKYESVNINSIPIEKIIWYYSSLKNIENTKKNYICPFPDHRDKTASFHIYKNNNIFICFWCWKKWNAINFISYMENIDNKEAFKKFISLIK